MVCPLQVWSRLHPSGTPRAGSAMLRLGDRLTRELEVGGARGVGGGLFAPSALLKAARCLSVTLLAHC